MGEKVYGLTVLDTWWMTETGGHMIVNYPTMDVKLGSMGKPLPGIQAAIIDDAGNELPPNRMGNLAIKKGWPSMMYRIWKNPENISHILLETGMYLVIRHIKMKMVTSGSKDVLMM